MTLIQTGLRCRARHAYEITVAPCGDRKQNSLPNRGRNEKKYVVRIGSYRQPLSV